MPIVYIRHAEKEHKNGTNSLFSHDPGLTPDGILKSIIRGKELNTYIGTPNVIYTSPFQRTRETMNALVGEIDLKSDVESYCLLEVSEYLGHWNKNQVNLRPETEFYNPTVDTMSEFQNKIRKHVTQFKEYNSSDVVIWIITHGFTMKKIAECYGLSVNEVPYLGIMVVDEFDVLTTCF